MLSIITAANGFGFWELRRHTGATTTIITSGAVPSTSSITAAFSVEGGQEHITAQVSLR